MSETSKQLGQQIGTEAARLTNLLDSHGIDISNWGQMGTKTVEDLAREVVNGEATVYVDPATNILIREIQAVQCQVVSYHQGKWHVLWKQYREQNGTQRVRDHLKAEGVSLSEKVIAREKPSNAMQRTFAEELGLDGRRLPIVKQPVKEWVRERMSNSYPGLNTRYQISDFGTVYLPADLFSPNGYVEMQENGTQIHFGWEAITDPKEIQRLEKGLLINQTVKAEKVAFSIAAIAPFIGLAATLLTNESIVQLDYASTKSLLKGAMLLQASLLLASGVLYTYLRKKYIEKLPKQHPAKTKKEVDELLPQNMYYVTYMAIATTAIANIIKILNQ